MSNKKKIYLAIFLPSILMLSCQTEEFLQNKDNLLLPELGSQFSGGGFTSSDKSGNAFNFPGGALSGENKLKFASGNSLFNQNWVTAPSSTTARDGLGPLFNARSCSTCHFKDGRGRPPKVGEEVRNGLLLQISNGKTSSTTGAPEPHSVFGGQFHLRAIAGLEPQGNFSISYTTLKGKYTDDITYTLQKPNYNLTYSDFYGSPQEPFKISPRVAPQIVGMGLIAAISERNILENEDLDDTNNDGISGKANMVWDEVLRKKVLGRFNWKASAPSVAQQTAGAFVNDMGITNPILQKEVNCPKGDCNGIVSGGSPEIKKRNFDDIVFYSSTLAVPKRRAWEKQNVLRGQQLFVKTLKCTACHKAKFITGSSNITPELSNQTIYPYSDFLLHDMGEGLADEFSTFLATEREWRTPPLWGIGLIEIVNHHTFYLHDGRARNIEEAILWHGGEAENSKQKFISLSKTERQDLISFLNSL